jgi:glycosyltransferase involved in cell wall biosynthesis
MKKIWVISKYGALPDQMSSQRQFSISKNIALNGYNTTFIFSRSNGAIQKFNFKKYYNFINYNGLDVIILNGPLIKLGISIKRVFSWIIFEFNLIRYALSRHKEDFPDVIIISSLSFFTLITGVLLKYFFHCKLIFEIRDIWPLTLIEIGGYSNKNFIIILMKIFEKLSYKNADAFVGTMPKLDLHISNVIKRPFIFCHIPMGFSDVQFISANNNILNFLPTNKFIVGFAGSIGKSNLVEEIILAAKYLENNKDIFFAIFGDGPLRYDLEKKYSNFNNLKFFGSISKYEIIPILKNCNILVSPIQDTPLYNYGISLNKWIDYLLSARPIIACYSGYKNILNEANCGFYIDPNNPKLLAKTISDLSKMDKSQLDLMGQNGYLYAMKYLNYEYLSKQYIYIINKLLV